MYTGPQLIALDKKNLISNRVFNLFVVLVFISPLSLILFGRFKIAGNYGIPSIYRLLLTGIVLVVFLMFHRSIINYLNKLNKSVFGLLLLLLVLIFLTPFYSSPFSHLSGLNRMLLYWFGFYVLLTLSGSTMVNRIISFFIYLSFIIILQYPLLIFFNPSNFINFITGDFVHIARLGFLFSSGNEEANILATLFPFVFIFFKQKHWVLFAIIFFAVILVNGTRTALLYFIFSAPIMLLIFTRNNKWLVLPIFILSTLVFGFTLLDYIQERVLWEILVVDSSVLNNKVASGNLALRLYHWYQVILETMNRSPLIGFGLGEFDNVAYRIGWIDFERGVSASPHNVWVWLYPQWGLIGSIIYLYFVIYTFLILIKNLLYFKNIDYYEKKKSQVIFFSYLGYLIWASMSNAHGNTGMVVFIFLCIIIWKQQFYKRAGSFV